jgi:hypothetical protein
MFSAEQRTVLIGAVGAFSGSALVFGLGYAFLGALHPANDDVASRLAFALRWDVFPAFALLLGIGRIGNARFLSKDAITGATPDEGPLAIDKRYLQNTLEQLALLLIAHLAFATLAPAGKLHLLPVAAMWFVVARVAFLIGYHKAPTARGFGFGATFYPTTAMLIYDAIAIVRG